MRDSHIGRETKSISTEGTCPFNKRSPEIPDDMAASKTVLFSFGGRIGNESPEGGGILS